MSENTTNESPVIMEEQTRKSDASVTSSTGGNASVVQTRVDEKLVDILSAYSHGLQREMSQLKMCTLFMAMIVFGSMWWAHWRIEQAMSFIEAESVKQTQYMERADKRHWELSRVIELSQKRSKDGKQQENLP